MILKPMKKKDLIETMRDRAGHLGESQELVELPVSTDLLRVVDADGKARSWAGGDHSGLSRNRNRCLFGSLRCEAQRKPTS